MRYFMELNDADRLLDPAPMHLETGFERLDNGILHVAVRTDLHRCSGAMFEWWFRSRPDTRQYVWWHPVDHLSSAWSEWVEGTHVGSIHLVEEFFTGLPPEKLAIQFRDPAEFFDAAAYRSARAEGRVSAAICGRVGFGHEPERDEGRVLGGRLLHIARDTEWGSVLRSHFYMGQDLVAMGKSADEIESLFTNEFGQALLMHCYNEFTFLSRFLPSLYAGETRHVNKVNLPW